MLRDYQTTFLPIAKRLKGTTPSSVATVKHHKLWHLAEPSENWSTFEVHSTLVAQLTIVNPTPGFISQAPLAPRRWV